MAVATQFATIEQAIEIMSEDVTMAGVPDLGPDCQQHGVKLITVADLGLSTIRILTNKPKKLTGLCGFGLAVVEQVPIEPAPGDENRRYLTVKRDKLGHRPHHQDLRDLDYKRETE